MLVVFIAKQEDCHAGRLLSQLHLASSDVDAPNNIQWKKFFCLNSLFYWDNGNDVHILALNRNIEVARKNGGVALE